MPARIATGKARHTTRNGDHAPESSDGAVADYVEEKEITSAVKRDVRTVVSKAAQTKKFGKFGNLFRLDTRDHETFRALSPRPLDRITVAAKIEALLFFERLQDIENHLGHRILPVFFFL